MNFDEKAVIMQRYKATIEYCGTEYFGMQKQEGLKTVQSAVEGALASFTGGRAKTIDYCGRTDAGVHAFGQVIHFDLPSPLPGIQICRGINFYLQQKLEMIIVKDCCAVSSDFHSRFSCKGREYKYYIYNHFFSSPIFQGKMHHVPQKLDMDAMRNVSCILVGNHDFSSFRGKKCQASSPIKTVDFIHVSSLFGDIIEIHIGAQSFLYKMVRNITGLLIYGGLGKIDCDRAKSILDARDISALPYTAPAHGLYFYKAHY